MSFRCTHWQTPLPAAWIWRTYWSNYRCRPQLTTINSCHCVDNDTSLQLFHTQMSCTMLETLQRTFYLQGFTQHILRDGLPQSLSTSVLLCSTWHIGIRIVTVWKPAWSELNFPKVGSKAAESWNCGYVMCTEPKRATQKQLIRNDNMTVYMRILFISHTSYGKWLLNDKFVWLCLKRNARGQTEHKPQETDA